MKGNGKDNIENQTDKLSSFIWVKYNYDKLTMSLLLG
jgi:hypothetical protein